MWAIKAKDFLHSVPTIVSVFDTKKKAMDVIEKCKNKGKEYCFRKNSILGRFNNAWAEMIDTNTFESYYVIFIERGNGKLEYHSGFFSKHLAELSWKEMKKLEPEKIFVLREYKMVENLR